MLSAPLFLETESTTWKININLGANPGCSVEIKSNRCLCSCGSCGVVLMNNRCLQTPYSCSPAPCRENHTWRSDVFPAQNSTWPAPVAPAFITANSNFHVFHRRFCWNHGSETALVFQGQRGQSYRGGVLTQLPLTPGKTDGCSIQRFLARLRDFANSLLTCSVLLSDVKDWLHIERFRRKVLAKGCVLILMVQQKGFPQQFCLSQFST